MSVHTSVPNAASTPHTYTVLRMGPCTLDCALDHACHCEWDKAHRAVCTGTTSHSAVCGTTRTVLLGGTTCPVLYVGSHGNLSEWDQVWLLCTGSSIWCCVRDHAYWAVSGTTRCEARQCDEWDHTTCAVSGTTDTVITTHCCKWDTVM